MTDFATGLTLEVLAGLGADRGWDAITRSERVQRALRELGMRGSEPQPEFASVYTFALATYGVGRPRMMRTLFRNQVVTDLFRHSYEKRDPAFFKKELAEYLTSEEGRQIFGKITITEALQEYSCFAAVFELMVDLSTTPAELRLVHSIDDISSQVQELVRIVQQLARGKAVDVNSESTNAEEQKLHARIDELAKAIAALNPTQVSEKNTGPLLSRIEELTKEIGSMRTSATESQQQNRRLLLVAIAVSGIATGTAVAVVIKSTTAQEESQFPVINPTGRYPRPGGSNRMHQRGAHRSSWFHLMLHPTAHRLGSEVSHEVGTNYNEQHAWWNESEGMIIDATPDLTDVFEYPDDESEEDVLETEDLDIEDQLDESDDDGDDDHQGELYY